MSISITKSSPEESPRGLFVICFYVQSWHIPRCLRSKDTKYLPIRKLKPKQRFHSRNFDENDLSRQGHTSLLLHYGKPCQIRHFSRMKGVRMDISDRYPKMRKTYFMSMTLMLVKQRHLLDKLHLFIRQLFFTSS